MVAEPGRSTSRNRKASRFYQLLLTRLSVGLGTMSTASCVYRFRARYLRIFFIVSGFILTASGLLRIFSSRGAARLLEELDPVLQVSLRQVLLGGRHSRTGNHRFFNVSALGPLAELADNVVCLNGPDLPVVP